MSAGGDDVRGCLNALDFLSQIFRGPHLQAVEGDACDFLR